jgi:hypothetical protein
VQSPERFEAVSSANGGVAVTMLVREIQISCLLASAFTLSILNYADDTALVRPVHQRTEKKSIDR